jgi:putative ABC transport system permease protein
MRAGAESAALRGFISPLGDCHHHVVEGLFEAPQVLISVPELEPVFHVAFLHRLERPPDQDQWSRHPIGREDRQSGRRHERAPPPGVYVAYSPATAPTGVVLVARTDGDLMLALRLLGEALSRLDEDLPVYGARTLEDVVDQRLGGRKFSIALLMVFSGLAAFLGAIGIYGVMSYAVAQRTREMGVRLALGAKRSDVVGLVLKHGVQITVLGLGLLGAVASSRLVSSQLFEVGTADPLTYGAVAVILGSVSMFASYVPARRASSTDPLEALRHE